MIDETSADLRERARRALANALGTEPSAPGQPQGPECRARLEAALRSLPRGRREIFLAVRHDALTYAEIAQRTGLSRKRVEREFARALVTLHRAARERRPIPWWQRVWRR